MAILYILAGILIVIAAVGVLALAGYLGLAGIPSDIQQNIPQWFIDLAPIVLGIGGIVLFIIGIITLAIAWGFLKGRNWARVVAMILLIISIVTTIINAILAAVFTVGALLSLIVSIIIPVLILWYLTTRRVKQWFKPEEYGLRP